jgi:HrpA-like RNA helicase
MSIANRVSSEMGDRPKSTGSRDAMVGYQIRLESKMSAENILLFCTTVSITNKLFCHLLNAVLCRVFFCVDWKVTSTWQA